MKGMAKRSSFGILVRKRFSDITNSQPQPKFHGQEECQMMPISPSSKDCLDKLVKENALLVRLIEDRNKFIELSGVEIKKLKICMQKLQLQNWNLAQSNSHIVAELNVGKEKLKALQHEITCKDAVLKAKKLVLEGKENTNCPKTQSQVLQDGDKDVEKCLPKADNDNKTGNTNRRRAARSRCNHYNTMGASTTCQQAAEKETAENKRRCLRRQSARFKSQHCEPIENLFEIEDTKFSVSQPLDNPMHVDSQASLDSLKRNEQSDDKCATSEVHNSRRSSVGRPSRRAAEKVQSYKEPPLNIKMRRTE